MNVRTARLLASARSALLNLGLRRTRLAQVRPSSVVLDLKDVRLRVPGRFFYHYAYGTYEPITDASLRRELRNGMTFLDVGAHIGYISLIASTLVGPSGKVHAIEPFDDNVRYLRKNVRLNQASNIEIHEVAAGAVNRTRQFHVTGSSDSNSFFAHPNTPTVRKIAVVEKRLDDLISGPVHAVKIDVEGAELLVLEGMRQILIDNQSLAIWVEWMPACMRSAGHDPLELPARLEQLGFRSIEVLNDVEASRLPLGDVLPSVASGDLPSQWYANLFARRA